MRLNPLKKIKIFKFGSIINAGDTQCKSFQNKLVDGSTKEIFSNTQIDDLTFGLEVILSNLLSLITIAIVGFMIGAPLKTILFLIVFIIFRTICDRYHAETFLACYILTFCSFFYSFVTI